MREGGGGGGFTFLYSICIPGFAAGRHITLDKDVVVHPAICDSEPEEG